MSFTPGQRVDYFPITRGETGKVVGAEVIRENGNGWIVILRDDIQRRVTVKETSIRAAGAAP